MEIPEPTKRKGRDPDALLVAAAVRTFLRDLSTPMACGDEALAALNTKLKLILTDAAVRATGNGRKTLKVYDI